MTTNNKDRKKYVYTIMLLLVSLSLIYFVVAAAIDNVNIEQPANNLWTNGTNNTIPFIFNYTGSELVVNCTLHFNGTLHGTNKTTQNNTQTTMYSNNTFSEGWFQWNISCINHTGSEVYSTTRNLGIDYTAPITTDDAPTGVSSTDVTIHLAPSDSNGGIQVSGINKTYYCTDTQISCTPSSEYSTSISLSTEGTNYVRYYSVDNATNKETIKNASVIIDKQDPVVTLEYPADNARITETNIVDFNFTVEDNIDDNLNCSLYFDGSEQSNIEVANGTSQNFTETISTDQTLSWNVICKDNATNQGISATRSLEIAVAPEKPVLYPIPTNTSAGTIHVYGYVNRSGPDTNVTVYVQGPSSIYSNWDVTTEKSNLTGTATINQTEPASSEYFFINKQGGTTPTGFAVGNYVEFTHQAPNLVRYQITDITPLADTVRVNVSPTLAEGISSGNIVDAYDGAKPTGWFNITANLFSGSNDIQVRGDRLGNIGPSSDTETIYYDDTLPKIDLTSVTNYSVNTPTISFSVSDDYALNYTSILANISNSTNTTSYNSTNIDCSSAPTCTIQPTLGDSSYNITVGIQDSFGQYNEENKSFRVQSQPPTVTLDSPANNTFEDMTRDKNLTYNVTDAFDANVNCTLNMYNQDTSNTLTNNTPAASTSSTNQFNLTSLEDGLWSWNVSCTNSIGLTDTSENWYLKMSNTPDKPLFETTPEFVAANSLRLIGFVNKSGSTLNFSITQEDKLKNFVVSDENIISRKTISTQTRKDNIPLNNNYIYVWKNQSDYFNKTYQGEADLFIEFSNHDRENFERYKIKNITDYESTTFVRIYLNQSLESGVSQNTPITVHNSSLPDGWFNVTLTNLFAGENNITVVGNRFGLYGPESNPKRVYYDDTPPVINLTNVVNYSTSNPVINFTVTDDYALNYTSIIVNISNSTNTTSYNSTIVDCSAAPICKVQPTLADGFYNITVTIKDNVSLQTEQNKSFRVQSQPPVIILDSPVNNTFEDMTRNITLGFNSSDSFDNLLNCTTTILNQGTMDMRTNNTLASTSATTYINFYNLTDGLWNWSVSCENNLGLTNTLTERYFEMSNTPDKALFETTPEFVAANSLRLIGFVNKSGSTLNFSITQEDKLKNFVVSDENIISRKTISTQTRKDNIPLNNNYIYVWKNQSDYFNKTYQGEADLFIEFSNHDRENFERYKIKNITDYESTTFVRIYLNQSLESGVSQNTPITVHNSSLPDGWFNVTLTNLFAGENNITVVGNRFGLYGPESNPKRVYYDDTPPVINLTNVVNYSTSNPVINFTVTDDYALNYTSIIVNISNSTNTTSYNSTIVDCSAAPICKVQPTLADGFYNITVTIKDNVSLQAEANKSFKVQSVPPTVILDSPANNTFEAMTRNITLGFNSSDFFDTALNCTTYLIRNTEVRTNRTIASTSSTTYVNFYNLTDGQWSWYVACENDLGLTNTLTERYFEMSNTPGKPVFEDYDTLINSNNLNLVGHVNKTDTNLNFSIRQSDKIRTVETTDKGIKSRKVLDTYTRRESIPENNTYIYVWKNQSDYFNKTYQGEADLFIEFSNHDRENFERYKIHNITDYESATYVQIYLNQSLESSIPQNSQIRVHNSSLPDGWFNVTLTNLFAGENNITLFGTRMGLQGSISDQLTVYYDQQPPTITALGDLLGGNATNNTPLINFELEDDYNISLETLLVNATNGNESTMHVWKGGTVHNNTSWNYGVNITCIDVSDNYKLCYYEPSMEDGDYNITISVNDTIQHKTQSLFNFVVKASVFQSVDSVDARGSEGSNLTTGNPTIYVNWTNMSSMSYFSHYELYAGTAKYPNNGYNLENLTNLTTNFVNRTWNITPGEMYFFNVRIVDMFGNKGNFTSSEGIIFEDNTPPYLEYINRIGTSSNNQWTNKPDELSAIWNFTDNQTGIEKYQYAIGTERYGESDNGWKSIKTESETLNNQVDVSGLTLEENTSYYFSVQAKNTYQYGYGWSLWYSSDPIKLDLTPPSGGSIEYGPGNYTTNSIEITYDTGTDPLSQIKRGAVMKAEASMTQTGQCGGYSAYSEVKNVSPSGTTTWTYNGLQDGTCYKFGLYVWDNAGNKKEYYFGNQVYNVTVDSTPPTAVTITDQGHATGSTNLYFEWTSATDPHSGIRNYEYALGTSKGGSNTVTWTETGSTSVNFNDLNLSDETRYYLSVRAYNNLGSYTQSSSDGILYLDTAVPEAVTVTSVGNDTNSSDGWYDFSNKSYTRINLTGESDMSCVWSYVDISYAEPTSIANYSTLCSSAGQGKYYCDVNSTEGTWDVHFTCKDSAGNKQTYNQNTDITFVKEYQAPVINISYPQNNSLVNGIINASANITDASSYNASYELKNILSGEVASTGTITDPTHITLNLTGLDEEYLFTITATDAYNHTSNSSVIFVVDNGVPTIRMTNEPYSENNTYYVPDNFNFTIRATQLTNVTYNFTNLDNQTVSGLNSSSTLRNTLDWFVDINSSTFAEGAAQLNITAIGNNSNITTSYLYSYIVDKTEPRNFEGSKNVSPATLYTDDVISLYSYWEDDYLKKVWIVHDANGSNIEQTASLTHNSGTEYKVDMMPYLTTTGQQINYTWYAEDKSGNRVLLAQKSVVVANRLPNITTTNISDAYQDRQYTQSIQYSDADNQNVSDYACRLDAASLAKGLLITEQGQGLCTLTWTPTVGNVGLHNITVYINDSHDEVNKTFNLTVIPSQEKEFDLTTTHSSETVDFRIYDGSRWTDSEQFAYNTSLTTSVNATLPTDRLYNIYYTLPNSNSFTIEVPGYNLSDNVTIYYKKLTRSSVDNNTAEIGYGQRYVPLEVNIVEINNTANTTYNLYFKKRAGTLKVFKFAYNTTTEKIDYNNSDLLTVNEKQASGDITEDYVYVSVNNFSAFVLVNDTDPSATNSDDDETNDPGGSNPGGSSSWSSSSSSSFYTPATCNDSIQNQGEAGIDCGGPCDLCSTATCHDRIQNQGEAGVDCGGPCSNSCPPSTCTDGIQNDGETGIDCGGPCKSCTPIATCDDGIRNGLEEGVDCGGSCRPCPSCDNGIKDSGEEDVDCGGVCDKECGPTVVEKPVEVKKAPMYIWFILGGIVLIGGIASFAIYRKQKSKTEELFDKEKAEEKEVEELHHEEKNIIRRYIMNYLQQGFEEAQIKTQLLVDGFKAPHIEQMVANVLRDQKILEIQDYIDDYQQQGYKPEELKEWIVGQGIDEDLVEEAIAQKQTGFNPNNFDSTNLN